MDFQPFTAPPSDHHPLNSGLGTENGTTAKGLIDGINTYLAHLFAAVEGKVAPIVADAKAGSKLDSVTSSMAATLIDLGTRIEVIEDGMVDLKKLVQEVRPMLEAFLSAAKSTPQAPDVRQHVLGGPADGLGVLVVPPHPDQPADAQGKAAPNNALADLLAGVRSR